MSDAPGSQARSTHHRASNENEVPAAGLLATCLNWIRLGIGREADRYTIPPRSVVAAPACLLAIVILIVLSVMFLDSVGRFPYYSPVSNVEELTLFYTSAGNFLKYGFLNSGFLADYSTSSRSSDHPYIYNHMPPGPDILMAALLKGTGGSYWVVRVAFWLTFLAGMICYFSFVELILGGFGLTGAGYAILLMSPYMILRTFDDVGYAVFPLLGFLPLLALQVYYRTGRLRYLGLMLTLGLISALYFDYLTLLMVCWCWGLLYFTQLIPVMRRHLIGFASVVVGGMAAHLIQNYLYLGPGLFFRELWMMAANRITGVPTRNELKAFYQANGLVHHGSGQFSLPGFLYNLDLGLNFPGRASLLLAALIGLAWVIGHNVHWETDRKVLTVPRSPMGPALTRFVGLWIWAAGTIVLPMCMLPAFTTEYGVHGTGLHSYFLGTAVTASVLYGVRTAVRWVPRDLGSATGPRLPKILVALAIVCVLGLFGWVVWRLADYQAREFSIAASVYSEAKSNKLRWIRRHYAGEVFMTNINPVTVGFFAREAGHGACELASLPEAGDIDPSRCHVSYMQDLDHYRRVRPRYFFFFREMFPGFSQCLPSGYYPMLDKGGDACFTTMQRRLAARFARITDTGLFEVYDLTKPAAEQR